MALFVGLRDPGARRTPSDRRSGSALPALLTGGYWYLRNLIAIGNPIPYTTLGPLHLPMPERTFELRPGFSVFHYATDFGVWKDWFFPGLDDSFGFLWPLLLAAFIGGGVYAVWRGGEPLLRVLGAVVLFTAIAYVFTPLTAAGEEGQPIAFEWNVRYIAPAAAVGLAMLPCLPIARRTERARLIPRRASRCCSRHGRLAGPVAAGTRQGRDRGGPCVLAAFAVIRWLRARGRSAPGAARGWLAGLAVAVVLVALGAGWWEQRHYLEHRYDEPQPAARPGRRGPLGARPARRERGGRRRARRLQPVPVLRHRPLERGSVARQEGPRRRL